MPTPNSDTILVGDADLGSATDADLRVLDQELEKQGGGTQSDKTDDDHDADHEDDDRTLRNNGDRDEELDGAANDEDRAAIRARRKRERMQRKQSQRERLDHLQRTAESLAQQNEQMRLQLNRLQNSDQAAQLAQLDTAIEDAAGAVNHYTAVLAEASAKNDGVAVAESVQKMLQARDRFTQLNGVKQQVTAAQNRPPAVDPVVARNAQDFHKRNQWYKGPQSTDTDSVVLTSLDTAVAREGFQPNTPAYWRELESRARKYLPHRFDGGGGADLDADDGDAGAGAGGADYNSAERDRGPRSPVGGSSQRGNSGNKGGGAFQLSKERVAAMKEAGLWDNPEKRAKAIASYKSYDAQQR